MNDPAERETAFEPNSSRRRRVYLKRFGLILLLIVMGSATFLVSYQRLCLEARITPAASMLPTIEVNDRFSVNKLAYQPSEPARGDIIVFKPPDNIGTKEDLVKRVIGVPGDSIRIADGKLFINEVLYEEPYILEPMRYKYGPKVVPADSYFVLGDNRNNSFDSHVNWYVPRKNIIGKAFYIYWPPKHQKSL